MDRGKFRAIVAAAVVLPLVGIVIFLARPSARARIGSFFDPLPEVKRDGGASTLPSLAAALGGESNELRTLREDAASGRAAERKRTALFAIEGQAEFAKLSTTRRAGLRRPDIMLRDDASVDRAVTYLTTDVRARERFIEAWKRSGRFSVDLARILGAWKVPDAVLAVAFVESAFQPTLTTDDAVGAWQLSPNVAHIYGLAMLPNYDERRAISNGTEAAARYLSDLRERFGSWELAVAAYAIGYRATLDITTNGKSLDFWALANAFPGSARMYVAEVMGTATVLGNLAAFNLDAVNRTESASLSDLEAPPGTTFALAARAAGISPSDLHELNPEYKGEAVPRTSFQMFLHVPSGSLARARELLPRLTSGDEIEERDGGSEEIDAGPKTVVSRGTEKRIFYRTRDGDTLVSLAKEHHTTPEMIASDNALDATTSLRAGTILAIRVDSAMAPAPPVDAGARKR